MFGEAEETWEASLQTTPPTPITLGVLILEQVGLQERISLSERDSTRSQSRSALPPQRGTHGRHDGRSESPSRTWNNSPPNTRRPWDDVPDTPQYNEVIDWEDNLAAGSHSIPPTNVATMSEETEILIKDTCTVRLEHANHLKIRNTYSLPQVTIPDSPAG